MADIRESESRSVVAQGKQLLERIDTTGLGLTLPNQHGRYYPVAPIYRSIYGVEGYLLVDHHPEERWHSYTEGGCLYIPFKIGEPSYCGHDIPPTDDPIRLAHFFNTDQGFKLVRFFHLPDQVIQAFAEDEFSGNHLIEKCTSDRTLPKGFDEVPVEIRGLGLSTGREDLEQVLAMINPAYSALTDPIKSWDKIPNHRLYFSFHPWPWYNVVTAIGEESIRKTLVKFDTTIEYMNPVTSLERRELTLEEGQPTYPALPAAYQ